MKEEMNKLFDQINAIKISIAKDRDKLRSMISEAEDILDCADSATDDLESAADCLSQYL